MEHESIIGIRGVPDSDGHCVFVHDLWVVIKLKCVLIRISPRNNEMVNITGMGMPDPSKLTTASGQLGPVCAITGKALKFSEAIVLDDEYVCWEAYVEATGASPSTDGKEVDGLKLG
tara:strand:- start:167 stop:517 length:351 start_codon:yes stop_codon:yes gene_type:complete